MRERFAIADQGSVAKFAGIAIVLLLYAAARVNGLADTCLWFDEIFSVHAAQHSWDSILGFVALDLIHPPLFYLLLKSWISIGGENLLWLRCLPVGISIAAVVPFATLCRELKLGVVTQITAVFLLAVNGTLIKYAQEVRMYSLLLLLSTCSMWLFARFFLRQKALLPLILVNILLIYTHYFGWFVLTAEVTSLLVFRPSRWRSALLMVLISSLAFVPWMVAVMQSSGSGGGLKENIGWMGRPGLASLLTFITALIEPFYYQASSAEPFTIFRITIPLFLLLSIAAVVYGTGFSSRGHGERIAIYLLGIFGGVPILFAFVLSWVLPYSVWGTRHLIIVFVPTSILLAIILTSLPKVRMIAAAAVVALLTCYSFILKEQAPIPEYSWCAWEPLVVSATEISPGTRVYTAEDLIAYHLWFGSRKLSPNVEVGRLLGLDGVREDKAYFLPRGFDSIASVSLSAINDDSFWFAYRRPKTLIDKEPLKSFLDRGYTIQARRELNAGPEIAVFVLLRR